MLWQQAVQRLASTDEVNNNAADKVAAAGSSRRHAHAAPGSGSYPCATVPVQLCCLLIAACMCVPAEHEFAFDASSGASDDEIVARSVCEDRGRRLWNPDVVYPMGVKNWSDIANCEAASKYECPCGHHCLSHAGGIIKIYEHRRELRAIAASKEMGGIRDTMRRLLLQHFDSGLLHFTNTFVVGDCAHVCERAFAVASSVSDTTFARARADVMQDRDWHQQRACKRGRREAEARRELDAWIRMQRETMEGNKISGNKWYTEKTTAKQLWSRYVASCDRAKSPTVGNARLLFTIWSEHTELKAKPPTGHAICSYCGEFSSRRAALQKYSDAQSRELLRELDSKIAAHHAFHVSERQYYDDAVARASHMPNEVTTITIDAPTRHQFDLPSQARATRDTVKRLDGTTRWHSKLEGVLDAGDGRAIHVLR